MKDLPDLDGLLTESVNFVSKPLKVLKLNCKFCGDAFSPTRSWQKFCCHEHKKAYHLQEVEADRLRTEALIVQLEADNECLRAENEALKRKLEGYK